MQPPFLAHETVRPDKDRLRQGKGAVLACDAAGDAAVEPFRSSGSAWRNEKRNRKAVRGRARHRHNPRREAAVRSLLRSAPVAPANPHCPAPVSIDILDEIGKRNRLHGLTGTLRRSRGAGDGERAGEDCCRRGSPRPESPNRMSHYKIPCHILFPAMGA